MQFLNLDALYVPIGLCAFAGCRISYSYDDVLSELSLETTTSAVVKHEIVHECRQWFLVIFF